LKVAATLVYQVKLSEYLCLYAAVTISAWFWGYWKRHIAA
jgi:hypothetical protein